MSLINITELYPIGSKLFQDSESYLHELSYQDTKMVAGGDLCLIIPTAILTLGEIPVVYSRYTYSVGISLETASVVTSY